MGFFFCQKRLCISLRLEYAMIPVLGLMVYVEKTVTNVLCIKVSSVENKFLDLTSGPVPYDMT